MNLQDFNDFRITDTKIGDVVAFLDGAKFRIEYRCTDKIESGFLTQIKIRRILKSGKSGKSTAWLKFRHFKPLK